MAKQPGAAFAGLEVIQNLGFGGTVMRMLRLSLPELALIAGTRAALGAGIAFLLADRLPQERRAAVGWTLLAIGAISTIPLAFEVFGQDWRGVRDRLLDHGQTERAEAPLSGSRPFVW